MARGDINRGDRFARFDAERDHRRRDASAAEMDGDPVRRQNFCGSGGEELGIESPVSPDDNAAGQLRGSADGMQIGCEPLRASPHVIERVILGDSSPPSVGTKFDISHNN